MRRLRPSWRGVMWGALAASVPLLLIWLGTASRGCMLTFPLPLGKRTLVVDCIVGFGTFQVDWRDWDLLDPPGVSLSDWSDSGDYLWFQCGLSLGASGYVTDPLWVPPAATLALAAWAWRCDRRDRRAARRGLDCPSCGYSRAGLAPGSPCPECGKV